MSKNHYSYRNFETKKKLNFQILKLLQLEKFFIEFKSKDSFTIDFKILKMGIMICQKFLDFSSFFLPLKFYQLKKGSNVDLEDLGDFVKPKNEVRPNRTRVPKEMISDKLRTALTKQGYHLVGSHSGVKICRWTKNQLRGRGGCYKENLEKILF